MSVPTVARLVLAVLAVLVAAGCQADGLVEVEVRPDGSGSVVASVGVDDAAAQHIAQLEGALPVEDLKAAGWTVAGPQKEGDGRTWWRASKPFAGEADLQAVLAEVSGANGPLRELSLTRRGSFAGSVFTFGGGLDFGAGVTAFGDPELTALLGQPFGQSPEGLQAALGAPLETKLSLSVLAKLPGELVSSTAAAAPSGEARPGRGRGAPTTTAPPGVIQPLAELLAQRERAGWQAWSGSFASADVVAVRLETKTSRAAPRLWRWLAVAALAAAIAAAGYQGWQAFAAGRDERRRNRRLTGFPGASPPVLGPVRPGAGPIVLAGGAGGVGAASVGSSVSPTVIPRPVERRVVAAGDDDDKALRVVVVNAMGVLFRPSDPRREVLVPFAAEFGSRLGESELAEAHLARTLGLVSSAEFWDRLGISGDPRVLDDAYVRRFRLSEGAVEFLGQAHERGLVVAAVANDALDWSQRLRQLHELGPLVSVWVVSAEVGAQLPAAGFYQALGRALGRPPRNGMVIDTDPGALAVARSLGYRAVLYAPEGPPPSAEYPTLRSLVTSAGRSG
ncbi:MAG: HAD family hydrolase [Acidimicrobiales bacterium]